MTNLQNPIKLMLPVQSSCEKYFALPVGQIIFKTSRHPVPMTEGRFAIVTDVGLRDAVDAVA